MCKPVVIGTKHLPASLNETLKIAVGWCLLRKNVNDNEIQINLFLLGSLDNN